MAGGDPYFQPLTLHLAHQLAKAFQFGREDGGPSGSSYQRSYPQL